MISSVRYRLHYRIAPRTRARAGTVELALVPVIELALVSVTELVFFPASLAFSRPTFSDSSRPSGSQGRAGHNRQVQSRNKLSPGEHEYGRG